MQPLRLYLMKRKKIDFCSLSLSTLTGFFLLTKEATRESGRFYFYASMFYYFVIPMILHYISPLIRFLIQRKDARLPAEGYRLWHDSLRKSCASPL